MPLYPNLPSGEPNQAELVREVRRAFWSRRRAALGDEVHLHAETRLIPNGEAIKLTIYEMLGDKPNPKRDKKIEEISGSLDACEFRKETYKLDWAEKKQVGKTGEYYFVAKVEKFKVEKISTLLYVDRGGFRFGF